MVGLLLLFLCKTDSFIIIYYSNLYIYEYMYLYPKVYKGTLKLQ